MYKYQDYSSPAHMGKVYEDLTVKHLIRQGWSVTEVDETTRMNERYNFVIKKDKYTLKLEVKGAKQMFRDDNKSADGIWVELINHKGYPGWLYTNADVIVFWIKEEMFFVKPSDLQNFILNKLYEVTGETKYQSILNECKKKQPLSMLQHKVMTVYKSCPSTVEPGKKPSRPYDIYRRKTQKDNIVFVPKSDFVTIPHSVQKARSEHAA